MMQELEKQREQQKREEIARQVTVLFNHQSYVKAMLCIVAVTCDKPLKKIALQPKH